MINYWWPTSAAPECVNVSAIQSSRLSFSRVSSTLTTIGLKKRSEKNAWLMSKFKFLSIWTVNIDAVFKDSIVSLFAFTIQMRFAIPAINIRIKIFELKNSTFQMANSSVKNVRVEKRDYENWQKKCVDSLSKRSISFLFTEIQVRVGLFKRYTRLEHVADHKCDKKRLSVQPSQSRKWLYRWRFPHFLVQP